VQLTSGPVKFASNRRGVAWATFCQSEGVVWGEGCAPSPEFFCISCIKMVSFYAFPVIFIDTALFKKGNLIKRAGVRTPWTPALVAPLDIL